MSPDYKAGVMPLYDFGVYFVVAYIVYRNDPNYPMKFGI